MSLGLALVLGTAGLPHILMRFFTVPDAKAARGSVVWAMFIIGFFYLLTTFIGFGARAVMGEGGVEAAGTGGNLAAPNLALELGGGEGTFGGDLFLAVIAGVAFATILAVVAGLVLSASGAVAHDIWSNVIRKGQDSEKEEVWVAKIAAASIGALAILIAVIGGEGLNVSFMVGLAFAIAASANFPALLLALTWRRFNTTGAVCGVVLGVVSAIVLIILSPNVWPGAATDTGTPLPFTLANPGIISIPLGFLGCVVGTMLSTEKTTERSFPELFVRSETGLGAEKALSGRLRVRPGTGAFERGDGVALDDELGKLLEQETFPPPDAFRERALLSDPEVYERAEADFEGFWAGQAEELLDWAQPWEQVLDWSNPPFAKWFVGGKLNVSHNCLDRHVDAGRGDRVAFHWRGEEGEERDVTYAELLADVQRFANALKDRGIGRRRRRRDLPADDPARSRSRCSPARASARSTTSSSAASPRSPCGSAWRSPRRRR